MKNKVKEITKKFDWKNEKIIITGKSEWSYWRATKNNCVILRAQWNQTRVTSVILISQPWPWPDSRVHKCISQRFLTSHKTHYLNLITANYCNFCYYFCNENVKKKLSFKKIPFHFELRKLSFYENQFCMKI